MSNMAWCRRKTMDPEADGFVLESSYLQAAWSWLGFFASLSPFLHLSCLHLS